ncbi:hypothetical protein R84B8_02542 [Treponema sp. R8-4-B8]
MFCCCNLTDKIRSFNSSIKISVNSSVTLFNSFKQQYHGTEKTIPHDSKYHVKGFPKDSFHIACGSHKARIQNILKTPGLDPIEKALLKQRLANMSTAQTAYLELQRKALTNEK